MDDWKLREPAEWLRNGHSRCVGLCLVIVGLLFVFLGSGAGVAQTLPGTKSPFGITRDVQAQPPMHTSILMSLADNAWSLLLFEQHQLTQKMTGAVRNLKATTNLATATGGLVVASFIYGILHAVGPGHGKAVISSYMLADKETLRRGIFLAFLSSLIQALSAITLIGGLYLGARATGLQTKWAEAWLETLSWGFVAAVGAWLMLRQIWSSFLRRTKQGDSMPSERPVGGHNLKPDDGHRSHGVEVRKSEHPHDCCQHTAPHDIDDLIAENAQTGDCNCRHDHGHTHTHTHDREHADETADVHDEHCGHVHLPGPKELGGEWSWSKAIAISFSIGVRPCTGALLVIIFAASQGLIWAGILATFAMAFGTALTVSALAAVSVGSRNLAIALAGAESRWGILVAKGASFVSSAAVFVLGTVFFFASLHDTRPF